MAEEERQPETWEGLKQKLSTADLTQLTEVRFSSGGHVYAGHIMRLDHTLWNDLLQDVDFLAMWRKMVPLVMDGAPVLYHMDERFFFVVPVLKVVEV